MGQNVNKMAAYRAQNGGRAPRRAQVWSYPLRPCQWLQDVHSLRASVLLELPDVAFVLTWICFFLEKA